MEFQLLAGLERAIRLLCFGQDGEEAIHFGFADGFHGFQDGGGQECMDQFSGRLKDLS